MKKKNLVDALIEIQATLEDLEQNDGDRVLSALLELRGSRTPQTESRSSSGRESSEGGGT